MFNESYGEVTNYQLSTYRRFNVSPSDHDILVDRFGGDVLGICRFVRANLIGKSFYYPFGE